MSSTTVPKAVLTAVGSPCACCGDLLERSARDQTGTGLRHVSRGLCTRCYPAESRAGRLDQYPMIQRDADELLDDYAALRADKPGASLNVMARELDLPRSSLSRILAAYADDPRSDHNRRNRLGAPQPREAIDG